MINRNDQYAGIICMAVLFGADIIGEDVYTQYIKENAPADVLSWLDRHGGDGYENASDRATELLLHWVSMNLNAVAGVVADALRDEGLTTMNGGARGAA